MPESQKTSEPTKISFGDNVNEQIRKAAAGFKTIKAQAIKPIPGPTHFCVWKSKEAMEIWLFCLQNQITQGDYIIAWVKLHTYEPRQDLFDPPKTIPLDHDGNIKLPLKSTDYQKTISGEKYCLICHNSGFAYVVRGILLDDRLMPGPLGKVVCWCKR